MDWLLYDRNLSHERVSHILQFLDKKMEQFPNIFLTALAAQTEEYL